MSFNKSLFVILTITLICSGCLKTVKYIFGFNDSKNLNTEETIRVSKRFGVDQGNSYIVDTAYYSYMKSCDTALYRKNINNHLQPMQALYYDGQAELKKFYINCYTGGIFFVKWNRDGRLETFLPKDQAPVDTLLNIDALEQFLIPLGFETPNKIEKNADYYVFVFWNASTPRHSKRLMRHVRKNLKLATEEQRVKLVYVNFDPIYKIITDKANLEFEAEFETKEKD